MSTKKNKYVEYWCETDNIAPYILRNRGVRPHNPMVEFYKDPEQNLYFIRILAIIPDCVDKIDATAPEAREAITTNLGEIETRTIIIKWEEDVPPDASSPFNLWSIDLEYKLLNEKDGEDKAIKVDFEYGDPKLSRGTVTTSGTPASVDINSETKCS
ncbi:hypothetical protein H2O64_11115 [Kordia sp. YSTF-M3]|uniref:Phage tail protein n=1 Tax=Kordia aestuariivivens TaxID=2759037 RepID=A0ABR7QA24_9FLAO|nr:hypothetical protein [Kordia aestuariivivens]MBC8755226.1 hypothetical protein [Kordia aestuariivivens]